MTDRDTDTVADVDLAVLRDRLWGAVVDHDEYAAAATVLLKPSDDQIAL